MTNTPMRDGREGQQEGEEGEQWEGERERAGRSEGEREKCISNHITNIIQTTKVATENKIHCNIWEITTPNLFVEQNFCW